MDQSCVLLLQDINFGGMTFNATSEFEVTMSFTGNEPLPTRVFLPVVRTSRDTRVDEPLVITPDDGCTSTLRINAMNCLFIGLLVHDTSNDNVHNNGKILYDLLAQRAHRILLRNTTMNNSKAYAIALEYATQIGSIVLSIHKVTDREFLIISQPKVLLCELPPDPEPPSDGVFIVQRNVTAALENLEIFDVVSSCDMIDQSWNTDVEVLRNSEKWTMAKANVAAFDKQLVSFLGPECLQTGFASKFFFNLMHDVFVYYEFKRILNDDVSMCAAIIYEVLPLLDKMRHQVLRVKHEIGKLHSIYISASGVFTPDGYWDEEFANIDVERHIIQGYQHNPFTLFNVDDVDIRKGYSILQWLYPTVVSNPELVPINELSHTFGAELKRDWASGSIILMPQWHTASSFWMQHISYLLMRAIARYVARNVLKLAEEVDLHATILDPLGPWDTLCFYSMHLYITPELLATVQAIFHTYGKNEFAFQFSTAVTPVHDAQSGEWYVPDDTKTPIVVVVAQHYPEETASNRLPYVKTKYGGEERFLFFPHREWLSSVAQTAFRDMVSVFSRWMVYRTPWPSQPIVMHMIPYLYSTAFDTYNSITYQGIPAIKVDYQPATSTNNNSEDRSGA